jgi:hypothetical protein
MHAVKLGDEVAVRRPDGSVGYEAVYAFGHRDKHTPAQFVDLTLKSMHLAQMGHGCSR